MLSSPTEALLYWQGQSVQFTWLQHKKDIPVFVLMLVPKGLFPVFSTPLKTDKFTLLPVRTLSCNPIHRMLANHPISSQTSLSSIDTPTHQ